MRYFIFALLISVVGVANSFELKFSDPTQIVHNNSDWALASRSATYDFFVNIESVGTNDSTVRVHTVVAFTDPAGGNFDQLSVPISRIYSFGIMECKNGIFNLLNDWFVDNTNQVVYTQLHPLDSYIVEMKTPNTPRNDLFRLVCKR